MKSALRAGEIFRFQRKVKVKIRLADFFHLNYISPLILPGCEIFLSGADCPPHPLPQAGGKIMECKPFCSAF